MAAVHNRAYLKVRRSLQWCVS